jgi:hypothetical protein
MKRFTGSSIAVSSLAAATLLATATSASASTASGSCSTGGLSATGSVNYTTTGGRDYVTSYTWTINGITGSTQNNVHVTLKHDVTGPDDTLASYTNDRVNNGYGYYTLNPRLSFPSSWVIFAEYRFSFDRNNAVDPYCVALTSRF